jgi:hypothetical protein|tara:strand:+ start:175533 stop:175655 length:123 start_codon:yes stop_codon:yes gene_type:complete
MVEAFMFGIIALIFYVIYEAVFAEDREVEEQSGNMDKKKN